MTPINTEFYTLIYKDKSLDTCYKIRKSIKIKMTKIIKTYNNLRSTGPRYSKESIHVPTSGFHGHNQTSGYQK